MEQNIGELEQERAHQPANMDIAGDQSAQRRLAQFHRFASDEFHPAFLSRPAPALKSPPTASTASAHHEPEGFSQKETKVMKNRVTLCVTVFVAAAQLNIITAATPTPRPRASASERPIPWSQIGATGGAHYSGDGLQVIRTEDGARLHCAFQHLDGLATREGVWLTSTVLRQPNDDFRVKAVAVGHKARTGLPYVFSATIFTSSVRTAARVSETASSISR